MLCPRVGLGTTCGDRPQHEYGTPAFSCGGGGRGLSRGGVVFRGAVGVGSHVGHGAELADVGLDHAKGLDGGGEGISLCLICHLGYLAQYGGEWLYSAHIRLEEEVKVEGEGGGGTVGSGNRKRSIGSW